MSYPTIKLEVQDKSLKNRFTVTASISDLSTQMVKSSVDLLVYQLQKTGQQLENNVADKYGEVADAAAQVLVQLLGDPKYQPYHNMYAEQYSPAVRRLHEALYKMGVPEAQKYRFTTLNMT